MKSHRTIAAFALALAFSVLAQGFRCPPAGTVVETTTGDRVSRTTYRGTAADNPMVCLVQSGQGEARRIANYYGPNEEDATIAARMSDLLSGKVAQT